LGFADRIPRRMRCFVYKSLSKAETYLYLGLRDDFERVPEPLRATLGALDFVLELELGAERKLARESTPVVRANLAANGFHVQYPPRPELGSHVGA
jgi:uncharacterized protein YcgL (UPF0745 family)